MRYLYLPTTPFARVFDVTLVPLAPNNFLLPFDFELGGHGAFPVGFGFGLAAGTSLAGIPTAL